MPNRRRFLQSIVAAATTPAVLQGCAISLAGPPNNTLPPEPAKVLELTTGLEYRLVSRRGDRMDDGLQVPGAHDGMAAFPGAAGRIILICNHELSFSHGEGLCAAGDRLAFPCTIGSPARCGQVFTYKPSLSEQTAERQRIPASWN